MELFMRDLYFYKDILTNINFNLAVLLFVQIVC